MIPTLLTVLALAAPLQAQESVDVYRYALVVGHNQGGPERVLLRYAHTDAQAMARVLNELGGVENSHSLLLLDPDHDSLLAGFDRLADMLRQAPGARTEVLFYYSGHSDEEGLLLDDERVGYSELREALKALPAKVKIGILDSCASGALVRGKGGVHRAPFLADESSQAEGHAFLTSASADEAAQEADRIGGSYFTHYLVSGLRGAADLSADGKVTLNEAYQFAFHETLAGTERTAYGPQHPAYDIQIAGTGDLVMTDLRQSGARLALAPDMVGRASIRDASGALAAELDKVAGRQVEIGLSPGNYTLVLRDGQRFAEAEVRLSNTHPTVLRADQFVWSEGSVATARGDAPPTTKSAAFRFGLAPGTSATIIDHTTLHLLGIRSAELHGLSMGFGHHRVEGPASGVMMTLASNQVDGPLHGMQMSLGFNEAGSTGFQYTVGANISDGRVHGMQGSAGLNTAGDDAAIQITAGVNNTGGDLLALQLSGAVNTARGNANGLQITGGVNSTGQALRGVQISGACNKAGAVKGLQITGGVNVADGPMQGVQGFSAVSTAREVQGLQISLVNVGGPVKGGQIGLINIGKHVQGFQIGLINVAEDLDGVPIGLVSVVKNGRHDLSVFASETDLLNLELKLGSRQVYQLLGVGSDGDSLAYLAAGIGGHIPMGKAFFDLDVSAAGYQSMAGWFSEASLLVPRARLALGFQVAPNFAPFIGASWNLAIPMGDDAPEVSPLWFEPSDSTGLQSWPGAFVGLQF